ncbi:MAG: hydantoinase B/oxoprolinase family protein, partial [Actinobacteria bacterium]|nr:hydantoinase B/oxoprolinase family protein [Actinomycetota bacterium]NIU64435.1 hydantoinase B/oxoprolinase family protein [Actinomycetota bacterium]NIW26238.1 hydantoinase B/oxoprolinase family protein [Actinomycetota bacterium]NIX18819.1 hydantoinase B/oxoprolinase family protein [Actinomycetota bacterium]
PDESLLRLVRANVRVPEETIGDLWAQVSCCRALAGRLNALLDEVDVELAAFADEVVGRTEQATRRAIDALPDGTYRGLVKNDGPGNFPG